MSLLSLNASAYARKTKMGELKKVKSIEGQDESRSEDSAMSNMNKEGRKKRNSQKEQEPPKKEDQENKPILVKEVNTIDIVSKVKEIIHVELTYPKKLYLLVDYQTGDIVTDIMMIPKNYWGMICFDKTTFKNNNKAMRLCDVAYWVAHDRKVYYIWHGKTVSLLKNT